MTDHSASIAISTSPTAQSNRLTSLSAFLCLLTICLLTLCLIPSASHAENPGIGCTASFTLNGPTELCLGDSTTYTVTDETPAGGTLTWECDAGPTGDYTAVSTGEHNICATYIYSDSNCACTAKVTNVVTVYHLELPECTNTCYDPKGQVNLDAFLGPGTWLGGSAVTWQWEDPDGATGAGNLIDLADHPPGSYDIDATIGPCTTSFVLKVIGFQIAGPECDVELETTLTYSLADLDLCPSDSSNATWTITPQASEGESGPDIREVVKGPTSVTFKVIGGSGYICIQAELDDSGCCATKQIEVKGCGNCTACKNGDHTSSREGHTFSAKLGTVEDDCGETSEKRLFMVRPEQTNLKAERSRFKVAGAGEAPDCLCETDDEPPQTVTDETVTETSDAPVQARVYRKSDLPAPDANGHYNTTNATPFATYTLSNPGGDTNHLRIVADFEGRVTTQSWERANATTRIFKEGNGLRTVTRQLTAGDWDGARTEKITVSEADDTAVSVVQRTYAEFDWGLEITQRIVDPDGQAITSDYTWEDNPAANAYGRMTAMQQSDGSWSRSVYDAQGRLSTSIRPWKDSPVGSTENAAQVTEYDYAPLAGDSNDPDDVRTPRTVTEKILGIVVSKSYTHISVAGNGDRTIISERAHSQTAAYGHADNLRSTSVIHADNDLDQVQEGRVKSSEQPDGTRTGYTYARGNFSWNAGNPSASTFTAGAGTDEQSIATEGTSASPNGIAYKTTRRITISDEDGRTRFTETQVYDGATWHRIDWMAYQHDDNGRVTAVYNADGTVTQTGYDCCGQDSVIAADGSTTEYLYDDLKRVITSIDKGAPGYLTYDPQADVLHHSEFDAEGRTVVSITEAGALSMTNRSLYNLAGEVTNQINEAGLVIAIANNHTGRTRTVTDPAGATSIESSYIDGRRKSTTGTATIHRFTDYGVNADGTRWSKQYTGPALGNSPRWSKSTTDFLGRSSTSERPGYGGSTVSSTNHYNGLGQLVKVTDSTPRADTLIQYDSLGNQTTSGLDLNTNGTLDASDRYTRSDSSYTTDGTDWFTTSWSGIHTGSSQIVTTSVHQVRHTGLSTNLTRETLSQDIHGNITVQKESIDTNTLRRISTTDSPFSTNQARRVSYNGLLVESTGQTGHTHTFAYDALRRQTGLTDPRIGESITHYNAQHRVDYTEDPAGNRTEYQYDAAGRRYKVIDPLTNDVITAYSLRGEVIGQMGVGTYPVRYEFNDYGQMSGMWTYRSTNTNYTTHAQLVTAGGDNTTWKYDEATGLLTNKLDAAGYGPTYTYTPDGRLESRTWARTQGGGLLTTQYIYQEGTLDLSQRDDGLNATYDVDYTYTLDGRKKTVDDHQGHRVFTYNDQLQEVKEVIEQTSPAATNTITRQYDSKGRPAGIELEDGSDYDVAYDYDGLGRFNQVQYVLGTNGTGTVDYTYLADSDLLEDTIHQMPGSAQGTLTAHLTYEADRNHKLSISNDYSSPVLGDKLISSYTYLVDAAGRRTHRVDRGDAFTQEHWTVWSYDNKSQVTKSRTYEGTDLTDTSTEYTNYFREYWYDNIGNRHKHQDGTNVYTYLANSLNQYTNITPALPGMGVTQRHDLDGNLRFDGARLYSWNAENRLWINRPKGAITNGMERLSYYYDYMGRRYKMNRLKRINGAWVEQERHVFLYDGWNIVREDNWETGEGSSTNRNVWGLDLSGSLGGAGGVGGLLNVLRINELSVPTFDGNGNIESYIDTTLQLNASYEFDQFGTIQSSGGIEGGFTHRFSTKPFDSKMGWYYYGYRFLRTASGQWLNQDPIHEAGGINLFQFVKNNPVSKYDFLGLMYPASGPGSAGGTPYSPQTHICSDATSKDCYLYCFKNPGSPICAHIYHKVEHNIGPKENFACGYYIYRQDLGSVWGHEYLLRKNYSYDFGPSGSVWGSEPDVDITENFDERTRFRTDPYGTLQNVQRINSHTAIGASEFQIFLGWGSYKGGCCKNATCAQIRSCVEEGAKASESWTFCASTTHCRTAISRILRNCCLGRGSSRKPVHSYITNINAIPIRQQ